MTTRLKLAGVVALTSLLVACGGNVKREVPATPVAFQVLGSWSNCKYFDKKVSAKLVKSVNLRDILLVGGGKKKMTVPSGQTGALVFLGMKPSFGYEFRMAAQGAERRGSELILNVAERTPARGANVAQMLTYPCALITAEGTNYKRLTLKGQLRGLPASFAAE